MDKSLRIQLIFAAMDKASAPMRALAAGSGTMAKALKANRAELERLTKAQSNIATFRALKRESLDAASALATASAKVAQLAQDIRATDNPTKAMLRNFEAAKRSAASLSERHEAQSADLQRLRSSLSEAGIDTRKLAAHERNLRDDIVKTSRAMEAQQDSLARMAANRKRMATAKDRFQTTNDRAGQMAQVGGGAVAAGLAIGLPIVAASKEAMTFQGRLVDIQKVMPNLTAPQLQGFSASLTELSTQIPMTREELALIAADGARAGIAMNDLMGFTANAAKMGAAFEIEAGEAGKTMAKWSSSMGLTQPQVVALADKVNALTNKFGGSAANVTDIVTRLGALGKVSGVAGGEIAAMGQFLDKAGVQSEVGATGIKNMMLALTKGDAATKTLSAAFSKLGIDAVKLSERMQVDARGGILSVLDAIALLPKAQQSGVLTQLFGSESVGAIAPLLSGLDAVKANFALVGDQAQWAGSMNSEFATAMTKTENQAKLAANAGKNLGGVIGMALLPTIDAASKAFVNVANGATSFLTTHPNLTKGLALIALGLAAVLLIAGGLALGVAAIMGPFAALHFALTMAPLAAAGASTAFGVLASAVTAFGRAMLMNPIGLAITAIAVGAFLIWKNWDWLKARFAGLWQWMVTSPMAFVLGPVTLVARAANLIMQNWSGITGFFANLWAGLTARWNQLPVSLKVLGANMLAGLISGITGNAAGVLRALTNVVQSGVAAAKNALGIKSPSRVFMAIGGHMMGGLEDGIQSGGRGAVSTLGRVTSALTKAGALAALAASPMAVAAQALPLQQTLQGLPAVQMIAPQAQVGPRLIERSSTQSLIERERVERTETQSLIEREVQAKAPPQLAQIAKELGSILLASPVRQTAQALPAIQIIAPQAQVGPTLIERSSTQSLIEREVQAKAPPQLAQIAKQLGQLIGVLPVQQTAQALPAVQMIAPQAQPSPTLIERRQSVQERVAQFTRAREERVSSAAPFVTSRGGSGAANQTNHFYFNVAPGTDPEAIAREVKRILRDLESQRDARERSTFQDDEEA